ncbi:uncharacterized protein LOC125824846 [Solanum verrucosum]|uniref:uncharacterized protein LOC125824846 n=1 Tax=Solanum verrucosum TaxID=315347 RepID=UPI0020D0DD79|nr:uncharacterized protein LOC125824846 [Solanum verrucosum]
MNPIDDKKETVTFRAISHDEEGKPKITKLETNTHNIETLKHIEKRLVEKGVHRKNHRPIDGIPLNKQSKSGHGGKFTWEGPRDAVEYELEDDVPVAIDENDPNNVDDEDEEVSGVEGLVVGQIDVAKVGDEGVARVDVVDRVLQENM